MRRRAHHPLRAAATSMAALAIASTLAIPAPTAAQEPPPEPEPVEATDATKGRDLDGSQKLRILIRNHTAPMRSVVVSVIPMTRQELVLGIVGANESRAWDIDTRRYIGGFRLVARAGGRHVHVSRPIDILNQAEIEWDVGTTDLVRIRRVEDG